MGLFAWFRKKFGGRSRENVAVLEKLEDIKKHPEKHRHNFDDLEKCCFVGGALDMSLIDAHGEYANLGINGGQKCDVVSGPCACGAWH